ncbi:helix-turn-helix domain-containing protein [Lacticaseibacillus baoqingensis]|uniref:Helix-turn-helix domain-containing protein n=2 Tax=Lacticaseibacillus baoqingensis TaxID=2486013 RepID=A0ABW4E584_9LACO
MRGREDIFLSMSETEKMSLFRRIVNARVAQTPVEDRLELEHQGKPLVKDVNLKQIASLTGRNYGSVYNTYNGLVETLEVMTHHKNTTTKRLFNVPSSQVRLFFVQQGQPYKFLEALLYHKFDNFEDFLAHEQTSKATMLRHLKPVRDFARKFGVRFSYETLSLQGDEKRIRVFLTIIFWMATDGAGWPFTGCQRDDKGQEIDAIIRMFDMGRPNLVTREIAMYYGAVAQQRAKDGHALSLANTSFALKYPVPNVFEELQDVLPAGLDHSDLSISEQMGESAALFFLFNFLPFYVTTGTDLQSTVVRRFERYNPEIHTLVTEFLAKLPVDFIADAMLPQATMNMLLANLLAVTVSIQEFGEDLTEVIAYEVNDKLHQMPENPGLRKKVRQTLEHVVFSHELDEFTASLDVLTDSFYRNVLQLVVQFIPPVKVKVAVVIEQTLLGYIDLLAFLMSQPVVELVSPNETDLDQADLVIESSTVPDSAEKKGPGTVTYKWASTSSNDWYGELYATIRQLWDDKMSVGGVVDY